MDTDDNTDLPDSKTSSTERYIQCSTPFDCEIGLDTEDGICSKESEEILQENEASHEDSLSENSVLLEDTLPENEVSPEDILPENVSFDKEQDLLLTSQTDLQPLNQDQTKSNKVIKDGSYNVQLTVNIAIALKRDDEEAILTPEKPKKKTKRVSSSGMVEAPKSQNYYHFEYYLLPDEPQPTKVDVVTFGPAAKIYMDNESKVLKPWHEGGQMWLGWSQSVTVRVNKKILLKLLSHTVTFRIWDTKDKASPKAKSERLKAFRMPQTRAGEDMDSNTGDIKNLVFKLRTHHERDNPKSKTGSKQQGDSITAYSELNISATGPKTSTTDVTTSEKALSSTALPAVRSVSEQASFQEKVPQTPAIDNAAYMECIKKNGVATVEIKLMNLLAGELSLTGWISGSASLYDGLCNISVDRPLISEKLKVELNPMTITILSATSLPSTPVPLNVLKEKCMRVHCQYKFLNLDMHKTRGHGHKASVHFNDVNVILTGLFNPGEFKEFLRGPPLEIEIHDRDKKVEKPTATRPALYGTEPTDNMLSSVVMVSGHRTTLNPFKENDKAYDPCGIARLSFSELLHGQRSMKVHLPIRCSPPPQLLGSERSEWERRMQAPPGGKEGPKEQTVLPGHYLNANSQLKVKVEIAFPLNVKSGRGEGTMVCPFGRIIYLFRYQNFSAMAKLRSEILKINAAAFELNSDSEETIERVLSCHKMGVKERRSKTLDFVTGFHMLDKQIHLFVLEGLRHKAIKRLWETVPIKQEGSDEEPVLVLYNSGLKFSKRIYDTLDLSLSPVHLHEPLETIMRQPLVYVRDMVPNTCFQAMSRITMMCELKRLKDVLRNDLFPSAEMVLSLSKEFGIVPGKWKQAFMANTQDENDLSLLNASENTHRPLDTFNSKYLKWKQNINNKQKDFVQENIKEVQQASLYVKRPKPAVIMAETDTAVYNYSTQALNSTEQAKKKLRKDMSKEPTRRFTYNQQYLSAMVEPCDFEAEKKASVRSAHRHFGCFTYPGYKSSMEANEHPSQLDEARMEELRKPWRENILHGNTLRPTLTRDRWPWCQRYKDFELYIKPPLFFKLETLDTTNLAADRAPQEQLQAVMSQDSSYLWKMPSANSGQDSGFKCYMGGSEPGQRQDILRDEPMKYSLRKPGFRLKPIPGLSVVQHCSTQGMGKESIIPFSPGPFQNHSLIKDNNVIPRNQSDYSKYHFKGYSTKHSYQHKRAAPPLTEEERSLFTFQREAPSGRQHTQHGKTQPVRNVVMTQTYSDIILYVQ